MLINSSPICFSSFCKSSSIEQILYARIKIVRSVPRFQVLGAKEFQWRYTPLWVLFLYIVVYKVSLVLINITSKKLILPFCSSSYINSIIWWKLLRVDNTCSIDDTFITAIVSSTYCNRTFKVSQGFDSCIS